MSYPPERLVPDGNTARCEPCDPDPVTYWPTLEDATQHLQEAHAGSPTRRTITTLSPGKRTLFKSTGGSLTVDGVTVRGDATVFDIEDTELDAKNVELEE